MLVRKSALARVGEFDESLPTGGDEEDWLRRLREQGGKVILAGNSLGGALSLYTAHERPDLCAAVAGLNPAGAELSDEAVNNLPRSFSDANAGAEPGSIQRLELQRHGSLHHDNDYREPHRQYFRRGDR